MHFSIGLGSDCRDLEIAKLKRKIKENDQYYNLERRKNQDLEQEIQALREQIRQLDYHLIPGTIGLRARTLSQAESDIKNQNLYIRVLEGELGPERTASCRAKTDALIDLTKKNEEKEARAMLEGKDTYGKNKCVELPEESSQTMKIVIAREERCAAVN